MWQQMCRHVRYCFDGAHLCGCRGANGFPEDQKRQNALLRSVLLVSFTPARYARATPAR